MSSHIICSNVLYEVIRRFVPRMKKYSACCFGFAFFLQVHTLNAEFNYMVTRIEFHSSLTFQYFPYCFSAFASRKSFTIGTIVDMRAISVTWVVLGKIASLDSERGCRSPD